MRFTGLRLSLALLTVVPVGELPTDDRRAARAAMLLAPLPRLLLGLVAAAVAALVVRLGAPPLAGALVAVGVIALGNRGMHLDGLSDTVDGLGAGWTTERALQVMRAGNIGPMGVVALIVAAGLQAACWAQLLTLPHGWLLLAALVMFSGWACAACTRTGIPAARGSGLGAGVAGVSPPWAAVPVGLVVTAALTGATWLAGRPWWSGVAAAVAAVVVLAWLLRRARRVFGGITGDVIGAGIELSLTAASLVVLLGPVQH